MTNQELQNALKEQAARNSSSGGTSSAVRDAANNALKGNYGDDYASQGSYIKWQGQNGGAPNYAPTDGVQINSLTDAQNYAANIQAKMDADYQAALADPNSAFMQDVAAQRAEAMKDPNNLYGYVYSLAKEHNWGDAELSQFFDAMDEGTKPDYLGGVPYDREAFVSYAENEKERERLKFLYGDDAPMTATDRNNVADSMTDKIGQNGYTLESMYQEIMDYAEANNVKQDDLDIIVSLIGKNLGDEETVSSGFDEYLKEHPSDNYTREPEVVTAADAYDSYDGQITAVLDEFKAKSTSSTDEGKDADAEDMFNEAVSRGSDYRDVALNAAKQAGLGELDDDALEEFIIDYGDSFMSEDQKCAFLNDMRNKYRQAAEDEPIKQGQEMQGHLSTTYNKMFESGSANQVTQAITELARENQGKLREIANDYIAAIHPEYTEEERERFANQVYSYAMASSDGMSVVDKSLLPDDYNWFIAYAYESGKLNQLSNDLSLTYMDAYPTNLSPKAANAAAKEYGVAGTRPSIVTGENNDLTTAYQDAMDGKTNLSPKAANKAKK